jgi:predicted  nucleic acid-binding Zn-ribbon protein
MTGAEKHTTLEATVAVLQKSLEQTQKQIEDTNRAISDVANSTGQQIREMGRQMEKQWAEFRADMQLLGEKVSNLTRPNIMAWIGIAALTLTLLGFGAKIIGLSTENVALKSSIQQRADQYIVDSGLRKDLDTNTAKNEVSEKDRSRLNQEMEKLSQSQSSMQAEIVAWGVRFSEMETQIRKDYSERNTQFNETQRHIIMLQNSLSELGAKLPEAPQAPFYNPEAAPAPAPVSPY